MKTTRFTNRICGLALLVAVPVVTLGSLSGCTRKADSSSISVAMPDWNKLTSKTQGGGNQTKNVGALSTVTAVSRVMINVSGPDIQNQIVYIWELNDYYQGTGAIPTPPAEHTLIVPRGSGRLIQVLAILEEIDTASSGGSGGNGAMTFYYGETLKSIANAIEPVAISLTQESTASSGDGSVSGRYFFSDGSTPTGPVDMYYAPIGRRPMIVERTSVFSGYFHFHLMPTVPFTFRMRDSGLALFSNVTTANLSTQVSNRLVELRIPAGYNEYGGGSGRRFRPTKTKFVGFAGAGAMQVGRQVCYPTPTTPISGFYDADAGGSPILWNYSSVLPTVARVGGGGFGTSDGLCTAPHTNFGTTKFEISLGRLTNGDSPIGNRGPFAEFLDNGWSTHLAANPSGTNLDLTWSYLPGAAGSSVDGVGIFYKVFNATENLEDRWNDNAPCNQLPSLGFTEITRVSTGTDSANPVSNYSWASADLTAYNDGRLKTVICPYTNSKPGYYSFAISHYNRGGGGPGGGPTATKIMATSMTEPTATSSAIAPQLVAESTCTALRIVTADASGNLARRPDGTGTTQVSVSAVGTPTGVKFYNDLGCSDPSVGLTTLTPYLFQDVAVIGMKADNSITNFEVVVSDITSGGSALPTITHHMSRVSPMTATSILTLAKSDIKSWQCYPIGFVRGRVDVSTFVGEGGTPSSLTMASAADLSYFVDEKCEFTASPGVPLVANQSSAIKFFKYTGLSATLNVTPDISGFSPLTQVAKILNVSQPAAPTKLRYEFLGGINVGGCAEFRLVAINSLREYSPVATDQDLTPTFSNPANGASGIYTDPSCMSPAGSTITLYSGNTKSDYYYLKWEDAGPLSLHGSGTVIPVEYLNTIVDP